MAAGERIGFIGLGTMGGAMARNLIAAGKEVVVYDVVAERTEAVLEAAGESGYTASAAASVSDLVANCDIVCTSLPHPPIFVSVSEQEILPTIRPGSLVVDFGTTLPSETRRLAGAYRSAGAGLVDAPVSGGEGGAKSGSLRVFAAGSQADVARVRPLLEIVGDPRYVVYCGPSGQGQVVKACNQMMMGLVNAALVETAAYGIQAGVSATVLDQSLGGEGGARALLREVLKRIEKGSGEAIGVKSLQLVDYARDAEENGRHAPMTAALAGFLGNAERVVVEANRLSPSFLRELLRSDDERS